MPQAFWFHPVLRAAALIAALASGAEAGTRPDCRAQGADLTLPYPVENPPGWDHDRFGTQPADRTIAAGAFVSDFPVTALPEEDAVTALPRWVAYEMRAMTDAAGGAIHPKGARRPARWYELRETALLWENRPEIRETGLDSAYRGFGREWNRGHLAARAHANRIDWRAGCNSHVFINALPLHARLNQGDWQALENYAAAIANQHGRVWTIAGPVFLAGHPRRVLGRAGTVPMAVPDAVFKILAIDTATGLDARAYLFAQDRPDSLSAYRRCAATAQTDYDLGRHAVRISTVERLTGLRFFTRLSEPRRAALDAASAGTPWPAAPPSFADRCGPRSSGRKPPI